KTDMAINHTPAFADGVVCVAEMGGRIHGLDAATGKKIWRHDLIDARGRYMYSAPAIHDGWFYAGLLRRVAQLRPSDGLLGWQRTPGRDQDWISSYGSPAISGNILIMSGNFGGGVGIENIAARRIDD